MENILVLDSGIGGLSTTKILKEKYPHFNYIYFKDTFNCPYGNKPREELFNIAKSNIQFVLKMYKIKAIVLACNTLSTNCLIELKTHFKKEIHTVTPKLNKINKTALVLCTKSSYTAITNNLEGIEEAFNEITIFKTRCNNELTYICAMHNLAYKIEKNTNNKKYLFKYLKEIFQPILNINFEQVVLGCTHYNYIKEELEQIFNNKCFLEGSNDIVLNI